MPQLLQIFLLQLENLQSFTMSKLYFIVLACIIVSMIIIIVLMPDMLQ